VVDDQRTFAEALGVALGLEADLRAEVSPTGPEATEAAERIRPDVVLMDLRSTGDDGMSDIRRLRGAHLPARIIVLTANEDDVMRAQALEAGATGFASKSAPLGDLTGVVRGAASGEALVDPQEVARLGRVLRRRRHQEATERQRAGRLTPRQTQILQLMADGASMNDIAQQLNVSRNTLRTHVQNILTRLSVHTQVQAVAVAMRQGKISARG
jgi:DNA-binding NarL/FixJ family response regulator